MVFSVDKCTKVHRNMMTNGLSGCAGLTVCTRLPRQSAARSAHGVSHKLPSRPERSATVMHVGPIVCLYTFVCMYIHTIHKHIRLLCSFLIPSDVLSGIAPYIGLA